MKTEHIHRPHKSDWTCIRVRSSPSNTFEKTEAVSLRQNSSRVCNCSKLPEKFWIWKFSYILGLTLLRLSSVVVICGLNKILWKLVGERTIELQIGKTSAFSMIKLPKIVLQIESRVISFISMEKLCITSDCWLGEHSTVTDLLKRKSFATLKWNKSLKKI